MRRESREWKPSAQFFKPLLAGWKREVVYGREAGGTMTAKPIEIIYHAPPNPGCKSRNFRSLAELGSFLTSASSTLTLHNFSFRKELMNAPKNQEIAHPVDEEVVIFPKASKPSSAQSAPSQPTAATPSESSEHHQHNQRQKQQQNMSNIPAEHSPFSHGPKSWKGSQQQQYNTLKSKLAYWGLVYPR